MSAFCVFGSSMLVARARVESKVPVLDEKTKQLFTETEFTAKVEVAAREYLSKMAPVQISPAFDAPSFCREWISLAEKSGLHSSFSIRCRGQKTDAKGKPMVNKKTGMPAIGWIPYNPNKR